MLANRLYNLLLNAALVTSGLGLLLLGAGNTALAADNYMMVTASGSDSPSAPKTIQAKLTIDAPPAYVWQQITNYEALDEVLPGYEKSRVIAASGTLKTLDIAMKVNPFLPLYKYQVQVRENPHTLQLSLHRISGDFKSMQAVYKLQPQNGGRQTLLVYNLAIDPGTRVPGASAVLKASTEKTLKAMQGHIEQSHRKSMIGQR